MAFNLRLLRRKTKTMNEPKIDTLQDELKTAIKAAQPPLAALPAPSPAERQPSRHQTGLRSLIASQISAIFNAEERLRVPLETSCEKQPKLGAWAEENLPEGFNDFDLPGARLGPDQMPHPRRQPLPWQGIIATARHCRSSRNLRSAGIQRIRPQNTEFSEILSHSPRSSSKF